MSRLTAHNTETHNKNTMKATIRYDSVYLTCSKKLTGSQLSLPHGTNKKLKCHHHHIHHHIFAQKHNIQQ